MNVYVVALYHAYILWCNTDKGVFCPFRGLIPHLHNIATSACGQLFSSLAMGHVLQKQCNVLTKIEFVWWLICKTLPSFLSYFVGNTHNLRVVSLETHLYNWIFVNGKNSLCMKIGNNEETTNESLPLASAEHACIFSRPWFLMFYTWSHNRKRASLHMLDNTIV